MKKKVRVYKPGGQTNQPTQEQVINYIAQRMLADDYDGDIDTLKDELAQAGIPEENADQYIEYVTENLDLSDTSVDAEAEAAATEEEQARMEQEQALLEEQQAAEAEARQARLNAMYNTDMDSYATEQSNEETYMQYGGAKPSKRSFVNKYTKLVKKAMGGNTPTPGADDVLNGREAHVKGFLGAVTRTAQEAKLKEEAEQAYNSIYGAPQVGAFQDGGIHQEEIDPENPLHHLSTYGTDTRHIFSDDMYTQNDVAAMEQFGGNTGQGLYKFIGGGDNVSADEEYQDADLNYQQYVKRGGVLNKYQEQGETTEDWKAKYDVLSKDLEAQKAKQDMIEKYMMQQYTGQQQPTRVRNPIISRGQRYNQAVGNPYYTATGEKIPGLDFNKLKATSIHVDKSNIFGRPKEFTINYGDSSGLSSGTPEIKMPEERSNRFSDRANSSQPLASWMMNTNIPGIRGIGSKLYKTIGYEGPDIPESENTTQKGEPNYLDPSKLKNHFDKLLQVPNYREYDDVPNSAINTQPISDADKINETLKKINPNILNNIRPYAYGGDISVPELYRAQVGVQVPLDPNENNMSLSNLTNYFTEKKEGDPGTLSQSMQPKTYTVDPNQVNPEQQAGVSQKFKNKSEWNVDLPALGDATIAAGNMFESIADSVRTNRQQNQLLENTTAAETNYGINNQRDKGTYDPNSGLFRPNEMGFNGVVKYGGGIYANGGNTMEEDEDVQYMTQEEIDDFIANGGELEYL